MKSDLRATALYREAEASAIQQAQPGTGAIISATELHASPVGPMAAFAGTLFDTLEGTPPSRICTVDLASGEKLVRTFGKGSDTHPRWSPDGQLIAFLSDRGQAEVFQIHLLDTRTWTVKAGPQLPGIVEYIEWSPDGERLLAGVAGLAADAAGAQGGKGRSADTGELPAWLPDLDIGPGEDQWRRVWVVDPHGNHVRRVSPESANVWEACWCGPHHIAAIASDSPTEAAWYEAAVHRFGVGVGSGEHDIVYRPRHQLGGIASSPGGGNLVVVEAVCSDRTIVAGDAVLLRQGEAPRTLDCKGCDVSKLAFLDESRLMFAGHRSLETVLGTVHTASGGAETLWASVESSFGGLRFPQFAVLPDARALAVVEGFCRRPAIWVIGGADASRWVSNLGNDALDQQLRSLVGRVDKVRWTAPDGLEIHGWLLVPREASSPPPLAMEIHGGPIWLWRQTWLGNSLLRRLLLSHGYAVFLPNPRGSSGRGQDFAARVVGDMGGADTHDYLSGVDHLVARGLADPRRLFVFGGSYGGFMSSWLVTQDTRFAAAVPFSPVTNWYSEHLTCHIPQFCEAFLGGSMLEPGGKYHQRSPVFHAHKVKTPTLNIAGMLDKNTPPGQAVEFHHALQAHGVKTALVLYPQEGHGVRGYPAAIDFATRVLGWFNEHLPREA